MVCSALACVHKNLVSNSSTPRAKVPRHCMFLQCTLWPLPQLATGPSLENKSKPFRMFPVRALVLLCPSLRIVRKTLH